MMVMDMDKVTFSDGFRIFLHKFNGTGISDVVITTGVSKFPSYWLVDHQHDKLRYTS